MQEYMPIFAAILGGLVVSFGWYRTGKLNRENNIHLKRLDFRIKALESFLPVWREIQKNGNAFANPDVVEKLAAARESFHLYGTQNDIDLIEKLVNAIETKDLEAANKALPALVNLIKQGVRNELQIDA
ncbi:hypothetical protein KEF85_10570 [Methylomonas paludis]|jgi:hypothetical protein|uniref:Uncharacterized protein n=1 Tax=Methylomonas paludis TaxID=1173101 RepID=A0A975R8C4_9GAMM|nr:hypothetical protein [Methylomonas paludis]QWF69812.1 hypothetical protein KEF85_10570 [Methylomonas paludis]